MNKNISVVFYMMIMVSVGGFLLLGNYFKDKKKNKIAWLFYILSFIPLFLMFALRYDVGTDYFHTYAPGFETIANGGQRFEYGFFLINKMISFFTNNAQWVFVVTGFIYSVFVVDAIRRYSKNPLLSLITLFLMCFVFIAMNNIRQQIACVIILWGYRFIVDKKFVLYLITCLAAMFFFHDSAIFMLLAYFIINFKYFQNKIYILILSGIVLVPAFSIIVPLLLNALGYDYFFEYFSGTNGNVILLLQNFAFFVVLYIAFESKLKTDKFRYGLFIFQFLAFLMSTLTFTLDLKELPERITMYFMIFQVISLPLAFYDLFELDLRFRIPSILIMALVVCHSFYFSIYVNGYHEVLPYQFIFGHYEELYINKEIMPLYLVFNNYKGVFSCL